MNKIFNIKELQKQLEKDVVPAADNAQQPGRSPISELFKRDISLTGGAISDRVKELFYLELHTLLSAGLDIRTGLELIVQQQTKKKNKKIFQDILQAVIAGSTVSAAIKGNTAFTSYECHSIHIGEETGKILVILNELAVFFQKKIKQRQQIIGAVTYPVMVIVVSVVAVSFMVMYVVPMFADVFKRFGGQLPFVTRAVLSVANVIRKFAPLAGLFLVSTLLMGFANRKKAWFRAISSRTILRIPLAGNITRKIYITRFCTTMALMMGSNIPIVNAIALARQMIGYYLIEKTLDIVRDDVVRGVAFHAALGKHIIFPAKMIAMVKAGEEVNRMELFFAKIAEQYSSEVEYQTTMLSKFLEPMIIIVLGLIVGIILIAMYLPLFKLGQSF